MAGYDIVPQINNGTFIASEDGMCPSGYDVYRRTDDYMYPLVTEIILCEDGQYRANGTCVSYTQGNCPEDRYNIAINNGTFIASEDGMCPSGYDVYRRTDDYMYPLVTEIILCEDGQYRANGTCVSYTQGNCPTNLYKTIVGSDVIIAPTDGTCPSGYDTYEVIDTACDSYGFIPGEDVDTCVFMCNGDIYTESGTCSALCALGITTFNIKMNDGSVYSFPVYSTKPSEPALNIGFNGGVCYVNLLSGTQANTLNIKDESGNLYHSAK